MAAATIGPVQEPRSLEFLNPLGSRSKPPFARDLLCETGFRLFRDPGVVSAGLPIVRALLRSAPGSDVLRPLQRRLEELKKDEEAREASAVLADQLISERLARSDASIGDKVMLWTERIAWGHTTGYGTRLGRIVGIALACWLLLALPLLLGRRLRIGALLAAPDNLPLHHGVAINALKPSPASLVTRTLHNFGYAFGLMFTRPDLHLRPAAPLGGVWRGYLLLMRSVGLGLLALIALTLTKVSPIIQAVLGKIVS